jgi:hypothetical protein
MKLNLFLISATAMVNAAIGTDPVQLETAADYAILAKTGISTVPNSVITGDIAVSPIAAAAITGFSLIMDSSGTYSTSTQVNGNVYASDYTSPTPSKLTTSVSDMETVYTDAAGRSTSGTAATNLNLEGGLVGGSTLTPGVYTFGSNVKITADIYLKGNENDIFIIQMTGNLIQDVGTRVTLIDGVQAKNIFWQVAGYVTVGATAHMEGILLVKQFAAFQTGSSLNGRILSQSAVTLDQTTITAA